MPEFSRKVDSLPIRNQNWNNKKYTMDPGTCAITVRDQGVFKRISQPAIRKTKEWTGGDILATTNPKYATIFLTKDYYNFDDSTGFTCLAQRVNAAGGNTKIRQLEIDRVPGHVCNISYYSDSSYVIQQYGPNSASIVDVTVVHINEFTLPLKFQISLEYDDMPTGSKWAFDARNICFIVPNGTYLDPGTTGSIRRANNKRILALVTNENVTMINRLVDENGFGNLKNEKSFYWITWDEWLAWKNIDKKKARGATDPSTTKSSVVRGAAKKYNNAQNTKTTVQKSTIVNGK